MEKEPHWLGHRDRLRHRVSNVSETALRPFELVELVLYHADPRADVQAQARALARELGSVSEVFSASRERLMAVEGVNRRMAD